MRSRRILFTNKRFICKVSKITRYYLQINADICLTLYIQSYFLAISTLLPKTTMPDKRYNSKGKFASPSGLQTCLYCFIACECVSYFASISFKSLSACPHLSIMKST